MDQQLPILVIALGILLFALLLVFNTYKRKKTQAPVGGNYFESSYGPIYYELHGQRGPVVLLLHGLGASSYCWRKIVPGLTQDYRVLLIDLFGFGRSSKTHSDQMNLDLQTKLINEITNELKIKQFSILGHSMGGHIALWYTQTFPKRVNKIMTVAPAAHPTLAPKGLQSMSWIANWTPWIINRSIIKRALNRVIRNKSVITDDMIDGYFHPYLDPDAHLSFAAALDLIGDSRVYEGLPNIQHPVLILWGEHDRIINRKIIGLIQRQLKKSTLASSPQSGHLPLEDDHEWVIQEVLAHLKS